VKFGPLAAEIGPIVWSTRANVNGFRILTSLLQLNGSQPNFTRCLAVSWAATLYIHFRGRLLPPDGTLPGAKFTLRPSLAFPTLAALLHSTPAAGVIQTLRHGTRNGNTQLLQRGPPTFGWAAITLGIGPHSSCIWYSKAGNNSGTGNPSTCWDLTVTTDPSMTSVQLSYCSFVTSICMPNNNDNHFMATIDVCVSQQLKLRTGGFRRSKVSMTPWPCWLQLAQFGLGREC